MNGSLHRFPRSTGYENDVICYRTPRHPPVHGRRFAGITVHVGCPDSRDYHSCGFARIHIAHLYSHSREHIISPVLPFARMCTSGKYLVVYQSRSCMVLMPVIYDCFHQINYLCPSKSFPAMAVHANVLAVRDCRSREYPSSPLPPFARIPQFPYTSIRANNSVPLYLHSRE